MTSSFGKELTANANFLPFSIEGKDYLLFTFDDLSDVKKAEDAMHESQQRYKRLVENAPDIIYAFSNKRGALFWSSRITDILGFEPEELHKAPFIWRNSIHPDDDQLVADSLEQAFSETPFNIEYRIKSKDGKWLWLKDRSISICRHNDEVIIEGIATDVTSRTNAEIEREKLIVELRGALKEIKTLRSILPLCSHCKTIRDDKGYWEQVDVYIHKHLFADISHSICPECMKKYYEEDLDKIDKNDQKKR